eukprot:TRINITY_DN9226_c0_g1_i1.p1 TRINITY_DN9226_c0_g1~~TRINITY_DN9226_c0_g1_i1.p1  ORF type:complete len:193 (+),score=34.47 TRINITY_DN9226_c0_g1_i1:74-652(+)
MDLISELEAEQEYVTQQASLAEEYKRLLENLHQAVLAYRQTPNEEIHDTKPLKDDIQHLIKTIHHLKKNLSSSPSFQAPTTPGSLETFTSLAHLTPAQITDYCDHSRREWEESCFLNDEHMNKLDILNEKSGRIAESVRLNNERYELMMNLRAFPSYGNREFTSGVLDNISKLLKEGLPIELFKDPAILNSL